MSQDEIIRIKQYQVEVIPGTSRVAYYAVPLKGDKIRMPDAYAPMYTDEYLAIRRVHVERPEVMGLSEEEADHYIPLRCSQ